MSFQAYQQFIEQFCQHAGVSDPQTMFHGAEFRIGETDFLMRHGGELAPEMITIYCALGMLPPAEQREAALLQLLESNLLMFASGSNPSFAFNAESGVVLLNCALWLGEASAPQVLGMLTRFDALAREWRATSFLEAHMRASAAPAAAAGAARRGALPPHLARVLAGAGPNT